METPAEEQKRNSRRNRHRRRSRDRSSAVRIRLDRGASAHEGKNEKAD
jgi:hypothetical protein